MSDVMIDLETLGTTPGSVILSIGAVAFDGLRGVSDALRFHRVVSLRSSLSLNGRVDAGTLDWWRRQKPEAQAVIWAAMAGGEPLPQVMTDFAAWLASFCDPNRVKVWGNGAGFDNVLIAAACRQAGVPLPWNGFNDRCFRTLKDGRKDLEPPREGVHHDALDDAVHQARWACAIRQADWQAGRALAA